MMSISNLYNITRWYFNRKKILIPFGATLNSKTIFEGRNKLFRKSSVCNSHIGFGSYIGEYSNLDNTFLGKYCCVGPRVKVVSGRHPTKDIVSVHPAFYSTRKQSGYTYVDKQIFTEFKKFSSNYSVEIGNDVWIGSDVIILEGVKISDGIIIGSGSVISQDLDIPYGIYVGNPSKFIRKRFSDDEIDFLLKFQWWKKDEEWLINNSKYFANIKEFVKVKN